MTISLAELVIRTALWLRMWPKPLEAKIMVGMNEPCSTFVKAQVLIRTHMPTFIHTNPNSNCRTKLDMFLMIILEIIHRNSIHHREHAEYLSHQEMEDLTHKQALQG